jgi:hypothetical protein
METDPGENKRSVWLLVLVWIVATVSTLPVVFGWTPPSPVTGFALQLRLGVAYLAALTICYCIYRRELHFLSRTRAFSVAFLVALLTSIVNHLHYLNVDYGSEYFTGIPNSDWQLRLHRAVTSLSVVYGPHSARFLPNAVVRSLEFTRLGFEDARDIYRRIFILLLFYALYRYARLHTSHLGALIAMLLVAVIYPVGFGYYAGQLTDPLAHLSFLLAFIFLEKRDFPFLITTILIGSLAKETVLVMAGYYILFCRNERRYLWKGGALAAGSAIAYLGVRFCILNRAIQYRDVSGVTPEHVWENLQSETWILPFLLTAGALIPFLAVGWRSTPRPLKQTALFLLPVLFLSSLLFSWLDESRNYMPVVFVLAVIAAHALTQNPSARAERPGQLE